MYAGTLDEFVELIGSGAAFYACPDPHTKGWYVGQPLDVVRQRAQLAANAFKYPVSMYRVVDRTEATPGQPYLYVRKVLEPSPRGEHVYLWGIVESVEAAEMLRDVSQGPSPYFGTDIIATLTPA